MELGECGYLGRLDLSVVNAQGPIFMLLYLDILAWAEPVGCRRML